MALRRASEARAASALSFSMCPQPKGPPAAALAATDLATVPRQIFVATALLAGRCTSGTSCNRLRRPSTPLAALVLLGRRQGHSFVVAHFERRRRDSRHRIAA